MVGKKQARANDHLLTPPAGDTSNEAVGRGPRAPFFDEQDKEYWHGISAVPERAAFRIVRG